MNNPLRDMRVRFLQTNVDIINHCPYLTLASSVSWILSRTECRKDLIFCCPDRKREGAVIQMSNERILSGDCSNKPTEGEEGALMRLQELQKGKACSNPSPSHTLLLPSPLLLQGQMLVLVSLPEFMGHFY